MKTLKLFAIGLITSLASAPSAWAGGTGTAPACIARSVKSHTILKYDEVNVKNNCGKTMKIQVDWRWAPDSPCTTLRAGQAKRFEGALFSYQRTETCT